MVCAVDVLVELAVGTCMLVGRVVDLGCIGWAFLPGATT